MEPSEPRRGGPGAVRDRSAPAGRGSACTGEERAGSAGNEGSRATLQERAARLAVPLVAPLEPERQVDCLEFRLSGESYCIEMAYVTQTLPLGEFTPLFCTPSFVLGIINLRGRIISIIDLRRFFELPVVGLSDLNRVIVVNDGTMEFGVLADSVVGVRALSQGELMPPPAALTGIREEFLAGVTAERLALLNTGRILSDPRIVVHEEVA